MSNQIRTWECCVRYGVVHNENIMRNLIERCMRELKFQLSNNDLVCNQMLSAILAYIPAAKDISGSRSYLNSDYRLYIRYHNDHISEIKFSYFELLWS